MNFSAPLPYGIIEDGIELYFFGSLLDKHVIIDDLFKLSC